VFWQGYTVHDVREGTCRLYCEHRNKLYKQRRRKDSASDISSGMLARELRVLKAAINHDYKAGRLIEPRYVWVPSEKNEAQAIPDRREVLTMARRARGHIRQFILIAYYTGQRKHKICQLRWGQVGNNVIDFQGGAEKTHKRGGRIPIPDKLKSFMRIWRRRGTPFDYVIRFNGRPVKDVRNGFKVVTRRLGYNYTPYSLRHASIIRMLQANVSPYEVAQWHETSVDVIQKHYGHYMPKHLEAARRSR